MLNKLILIMVAFNMHMYSITYECVQFSHFLAVMWVLQLQPLKENKGQNGKVSTSMHGLVILNLSKKATVWAPGESRGGYNESHHSG